MRDIAANMRTTTVTDTASIRNNLSLSVSGIGPGQIVIGTIKAIMKTGAYRGQSNRAAIVSSRSHRTTVNRRLFAPIRSKALFVCIARAIGLYT